MRSGSFDGLSKPAMPRPVNVNRLGDGGGGGYGCGHDTRVHLVSGLLALLDDVAALARMAATSVDDIAAAAAKAGSKTAGVLIDDTAVTPAYLHGLDARRELPVIWRITKGSLKNKLIFLLPAAILLANFLPQAVTPLLMLGGAYLCFEGAEKIWHLIFPHTDHGAKAHAPKLSAQQLEESRIAGAIKTDFILSAEIMTIALAQIPASGWVAEAVTLALVGAGITLLVYGTVALIVKADDVGLHLAASGRFGATRAFGKGLVTGMPRFLRALTAVGTAAMLWVGGSIVIHGMEALGAPALYDAIHHAAVAAADAVGRARGFVEWAVTALFDGVLGLAFGLLLIPVATRVLVPVYRMLTSLRDPSSQALFGDLASLLGRVLIALLFIGGAVQKGTDPSAVEGLLASRGWWEWLIWPALAFDLVAGVALVLGVQARVLGVLLAGYCMVTSYFHFLPDDPWQMTIFVKNWAIAGGCLVLAAHGAGRFALRGRAEAPEPAKRGRTAAAH